MPRAKLGCNSNFKQENKLWLTRFKRPLQGHNSSNPPQAVRALALPVRDAVVRVVQDAVVRDAVVRDAVVRDAVVRGAVVRGAVVRGAVVRGAVVRGAVASLQMAVLLKTLSRR